MVSISLKYFGIVKTCILANLKPALTSNITRKKKSGKHKAERFGW